MTYRTQIHKKIGKNGFRTLQGTMSHRPLSNTSSLKITAAYYIAFTAAPLKLSPNCDIAHLKHSKSWKSD
jgi:hypothetical protein